MIILSVFTHVLIAYIAASITGVLQSWATVLQTEYKFLIGRISDIDRVHMFIPSCRLTRQQKWCCLLQMWLYRANSCSLFHIR